MPKKRSAASVVKSVKSLKSYLTRLGDATETKPLAAFAAFPKETTFDGQNPDEHIVLLLRQHLAVFIPKAFVVIGMSLLPFVVVPLLRLLDVDIAAGNVAFGLGILVLWIMLIISVVVVTFLKWYFNVNIVTDQRIVDIDFNQLFDHRVSECQLEKIQDVSHSNVGMWSVLFDYGTVYIQTAAEQREFEFRNVPRARDVQDTINDLLELKQ